MDWSRYPNFKADEFKCSHCGDNEIKEELLDKLQALRSRYGKPMRITSGYRCPRHPIEAAKSAPGPHSSGLACDVGVEGADAHKLLGLALDAGFRGIGVQQKGTGRFLHLDLLNAPNRPTVWSY
jgi:zinc D-Ala-D-Ala carboxypeptidase